MNHYPRHVGDYLKDTAHLSLIEHGIYTRLLDVYYTREGPLQGDVARLIGARTDDERASVAMILSEFFVQTSDGWAHKRCDAEIVKFRLMAEGGRRGAAIRWGKGADSPPIAPPPLGQCQPEPEPEPEPKREREPRATRLASCWVLPQDWRAWAKTNRPDLDPDLTAAKFADYWRGKGGKDGRKLDWLATWRNWVREERAPPRNPADIARTTVPPSGKFFTPEPPLTPEQREAADKVRRSVMANLKMVKA